MEYYDRLPRPHRDKCYKWVSDLIDTLVKNARHKRNTESLVLDASGKEQIPWKPKIAMPAESRGAAQPTSVSEPLGGDGVGGGGGSVGGGSDPGKGRGRGGKRPGAKGGGSEGNPDSEHGSTVSGSRPPCQRICISNFWKQ